MSPLADTTVLNNFAQIRRPDLLRGAWPDLAAPIPVWNELELGVRLGFVPACDWSWLKLLDLTEQARLTALTAAPSSDTPAAIVRRAHSRKGD